MLRLYFANRFIILSKKHFSNFEKLSKINANKNLRACKKRGE